MPEQATPSRGHRSVPAPTPSESALRELDPETREKLAWQEKEIMRLRDLLIGKDAELGVVKGKLAVAEDRMERLMAVRERITTSVPGSNSILRLFSRLLRRRR
jgi:hypothetical protein